MIEGVAVTPLNINDGRAGPDALPIRFGAIDRANRRHDRLRSFQLAKASELRIR